MKKLILILFVISIQISYSKWENSSNWKQEGTYSYSSIYITNNIIYVVFNSNAILISKDEADSWETINTSFNKITSLIIKDGFIWVATDSGVFVSQDEGKTWEGRNNGLTDLSIQALEKNENKIYLASKGNFYVSEDEGLTWIEKNSGIPNNLDMNLIKINQDNSNLFIGTSSGLYYSDDDGSNWNYIGPKQNTVTSIEFSQNKMFAGIGTIYADGGLYETSDNGNNWSRLKAGSVISLLIYQGKFFCGFSFSGILTSSDEGSTWDVTIINNDNEFKEFDLGDSQQLPEVPVMGVLNNKIIAGTQNGLFVSTDKGDTWLTKILRENDGMASKIFVNNDEIFVSTIYPYVLGYLNIGNILVSSNQGMTWTKINKEPLIYRVRSIAVSGDTIFAGTDGYGLFLTTNKGETWEKRKITDSSKTIPTEITNINKIYSINLKDNYIVVGTYGGIYLSEDKGITWKRWFFDDSGSGFSIFSIVNNEDEYFASTSLKYSKIMYKTDGIGSKWVDLTNNFNFPFYTGQLTPGYVRSLFLNNENIYALITGSGQSTDGIYLSTDDGESWINKRSDIHGYGNDWNDIIMPLSLTVKDNNIFVGSERDGIYVSTDNGSTWSEHHSNKNDGLPPFHTDNGWAGYQVNSFVISDDFLFASLNSGYGNPEESGVYKIRIDDITDVKSEEENLSGNPIFPNPVTDFAQLRLDKEFSGFITISIVDLLGNTTQIYSGEVSGDSSLNHDFSSFPTGFYSLIIDYGTKREVVKVIKE